MDLREGATDRERELCARAEARVRRKRAVHADARACRQTMMREEPAGRIGRSIGIFPNDFQLVCRGGGHEQRGPGGRRADAPKPAPERAAQIEDAEVQAGGRFD
jgi:hypothetical protein